MDKQELRQIKKEMAAGTREAKTACKRVKVAKSKMTKAEADWEALIELSNEIFDDSGAKIK